MSESIMVGIAAGKKKVEAAVEAAQELRVPLLTSSLTTSAAFLPIFLAESSTGEYTAPLFKVVTITLICSWLLSLTMIPALCVAFMKVKVKASEETFIAEELATNEERAEGVLNWASFIGQGPPRFALTYSPRMASPEYAMLLLNTTSYAAVLEQVPKLERFVLENYPDVKPTVRSLINGPPVKDPIEVRISGEDADEVFAIVDQVKAKLGSRHRCGVGALQDFAARPFEDGDGFGGAGVGGGFSGYLQPAQSVVGGGGGQLAGGVQLGVWRRVGGFGRGQCVGGGKSAYWRAAHRHVAGGAV